MPARFTSWLDYGRRLLAVGGAWLVLGLAILSFSPDLHHDLHAGTSQSAAEGCAVELFASGVSLPVGALALVPPVPAWQEAAPDSADAVLLTSPRYLHLPERGPPSLG